MDVQGKGVSIAAGDSSPSTTDDTDFGTADITTGTVDHTFTIRNTGNANLNLTATPKVSISGTHAADFSVTVQPTTPVASGGGTTTFTVRFDPSATGVRTATISIANNDSDENPYDFALQGTGTAPPDMTVNPTLFSKSLQPDGTATDTLTIGNTGQGTLDWTIDTQLSPATGLSCKSRPAVPQATGGPDSFGYIWIDSDEPGGPTYEWIDITGSGELLDSLGDDDCIEESFPPGVTFAFYGQEKSSVTIASNGYLSFDTDPCPEGSYTNTNIPNNDPPNDLIAPFWDDLNPSQGGQIYCRNDPDRLIVSWIGIPHYYNQGSYTFQVILNHDGTIVYQYQDMGNGGPTDSATIGIENASGTDGLQVAYNSSYVHDNLAIKIYKPNGCGEDWLRVDRNSGSVPAGESTDIQVTFDATGLTSGTNCSANIVIASNDLDENPVTVPAALAVTDSGTAAVFRVESTGDILADGSFYGSSFETGSADVAEWVSVSEPVEPGDVLELDPENSGYYHKSQTACSSLVAGVVSTNPGFVLGSEVQGSAIGVNDLTPDSASPTAGSLASGFEGSAVDSGLSTPDSRLSTGHSALLALIGIVPVKVTDEGGAIQPGDLLVSSSTPGYTMRWDSGEGEACGLVGKALEPLESGTGVIQVLLMR